MVHERFKENISGDSLLLKSKYNTFGDLGREYSDAVKISKIEITTVQSLRWK